MKGYDRGEKEGVREGGQKGAGTLKVCEAPHLKRHWLDRAHLHPTAAR